MIGKEPIGETSPTKERSLRDVAIAGLLEGISSRRRSNTSGFVK